MAKQKLRLVVSPNGTLSAIAPDNLTFLATLGQLDIKRVSNVEPDANNQWNADLSPVGGPILGPFEDRKDALAAEVAWLEPRLGLFTTKNQNE
jgi:hypothetical protein